MGRNVFVSERDKIERIAARKFDVGIVDREAGDDRGGASHPLLSVAALLAEARDVFTPAEMEERLSRYERMVEQNKPLPLFGNEQPQKAQRVLDSHLEMECWGCGRIAKRKGLTTSRRLLIPLPASAPKESKRYRKKALRQRERRWHSRIWRWNITETYCPKCFKKWGWRDDYDANKPCPGRQDDTTNRGAQARGLDGTCEGGKPARDASAASGAGGTPAVGVQCAPVPDRACIGGIG